MRRDHILTLSCPDTTGIVYRVTGLLFDAGCNILDAQQFGDEESGRFFLRVHFDVPGATEIDVLHEGFASLAAMYLLKSGLMTTASGQAFSALNIGMAEWTPYWRAM